MTLTLTVTLALAWSSLYALYDAVPDFLYPSLLPALEPNLQRLLASGLRVLCPSLHCTYLWFVCM